MGTLVGLLSGQYTQVMEEGKEREAESVGSQRKRGWQKGMLVEETGEADRVGS